LSDKARIYLKWPKIPTTAIVIPAKYVYVSPTKTEDGYLEQEQQQTFSELLSVKCEYKVSNKMIEIYY